MFSSADRYGGGGLPGRRPAPRGSWIGQMIALDRLSTRRGARGARRLEKGLRSRARARVRVCLPRSAGPRIGVGFVDRRRGARLRSKRLRCRLFVRKRAMPRPVATLGLRGRGPHRLDECSTGPPGSRAERRARSVIRRSLACVYPARARNVLSRRARKRASWRYRDGAENYDSTHAVPPAALGGTAAEP